MWRALPPAWLIAYFVFFSIVAFVALWWLAGRPHLWRKGLHGLWVACGLASSALTIVTLTSLFAGKFLWVALASLPYISTHYPDINGKWKGDLHSTYSSTPYPVE